MSEIYFVFLYTQASYKELTDLKDVTCESVCKELCKQLTVAPVSCMLFSLREYGTNNYLPSCRDLLVTKKYEFRIRFFAASLSEFKQLDCIAFDYFYRQIRYDLEHSLILDLEYPNHKEKVVGLAVTNMFIDILENITISIKSLRSKYKSYLPRKFYKKHRYTLKPKVEQRLTQLLQHNKEAMYV